MNGNQILENVHWDLHVEPARARVGPRPFHLITRDELDAPVEVGRNDRLEIDSTRSGEAAYAPLDPNRTWTVRDFLTQVRYVVTRRIRPTRVYDDRSHNVVWSTIGSIARTIDSETHFGNPQFESELLHEKLTWLQLFDLLHHVTGIERLPTGVWVLYRTQEYENNSNNNSYGN